MRDLADQAQLSRSGLTRLVDRLERDGLLERCSCSHDARGSYACLTGSGSSASAKPAHAPAVVRAQFFSHFTEGELAALADMWERIAPCGTARGARRPSQPRLHVHVARVLRLAAPAPSPGPLRGGVRQARPHACAGGGGRGSLATSASSTATRPKIPNASIACSRPMAEEVARSARSRSPTRIPPRAFHSRNERQRMRGRAGQPEAHTRSPSRNRRRTRPSARAAGRRARPP